MNPGGCGCCAGSNTDYQLKTGNVETKISTISCPSCSPGEAPLELHVHVSATVPAPKQTCFLLACWTDYSGSDWIPEGASLGCEKENAGETPGNGCLGVYEIGHPAMLYDSQFTYGWTMEHCNNPIWGCNPPLFPHSSYVPR